MNLYAPDDTEWKDLGPATKKRWPHGVPTCVVKDGISYYFKEYAGHVYLKTIPPSEPESPS